MNKRSLSAEARRKTILSIVLGVICVIYVLPVLTVVINSFKLNTYVKTDTFALPNAESFAGWANFIKGLTFGNYPFLKSAGYSLFITIVSTALILLCTSMAAWYIARVDSKFCRMVYYLCIFSMVVPFQMVMFTLSKSALARGLRFSCSSALSNPSRLKLRRRPPSTAAARCARTSPSCCRCCGPR